MKKIIYSIGAITTISTPLVLVISCGKKTSTSTKKPGTSTKKEGQKNPPLNSDKKEKEGREIQDELNKIKDKTTLEIDENIKANELKSSHLNITQTPGFTYIYTHGKIDSKGEKEVTVKVSKNNSKAEPKTKIIKVNVTFSIKLIKENEEREIQEELNKIQDKTTLEIDEDIKANELKSSHLNITQTPGFTYIYTHGKIDSKGEKEVTVKVSKNNSKAEPKTKIIKVNVTFSIKLIKENEEREIQEELNKIQDKTTLEIDEDIKANELKSSHLNITQTPGFTYIYTHGKIDSKGEKEVTVKVSKNNSKAEPKTKIIKVNVTFSIKLIKENEEREIQEELNKIQDKTTLEIDEDIKANELKSSHLNITQTPGFTYIYTHGKIDSKGEKAVTVKVSKNNSKAEPKTKIIKVNVTFSIKLTKEKWESATSLDWNEYFENKGKDIILVKYNEKIKKFYIPNIVTQIGEDSKIKDKDLSDLNHYKGVFEGLTITDQLTIPASVKKISPYSFFKTTFKDNVVASHKIEAGRYAFSEAIFEKNINVNSFLDNWNYSSEHIFDNSVFHNDVNISSNLSDGSIYYNMFRYATFKGVVSINLPYIYDSSFRNAKFEKELIFGEKVKSVQINAFNCASFTIKLDMSKSQIVKIYQQSFKNATFKDLVLILPKNLTEIEEEAFADPDRSHSYSTIIDFTSIFNNSKRAVETLKIGSNAFWHNTDKTKIKIAESDLDSIIFQWKNSSASHSEKLKQFKNRIFGGNGSAVLRIDN